MVLIQKDPSFKSNHMYLIGKSFDKVFSFKVISFLGRQIFLPKFLIKNITFLKIVKPGGLHNI